MRILSIHNQYQIRGGEDESSKSEQQLLREMGHEVDIYQEHNDRVAEIGALPMALRTVWSQESYNIVKQKLSSSKYDVVHIQNFFPLISPSVYYAAKSEGVPVVQTLRNYRLLCPNGLFFRDGQVCEDCMGKNIPFPGVMHGCYRESLPASGAVATMLTLHRAMRTWTQMVDVYISLTEFARQKFIAGGFPPDKIVVKPNFINPDPGIGQGKGGYALFVGRLSVEKGLDTLLEAWEKLDNKIPLKIIGDGPLSSQVLEAAKRIPEVEWLGRKPMSEVHQLMGEATFLVFPSKWYETFGRVAAEAFAKGTPVIAANIGAIAELVDSGRTGLHFSPGDSKDLAAKVQWAIENPTKLLQMRKEARIKFEANFTAQQNYRRMMEIYDMVANPKLLKI
ncbi:MAG: glycosyltransferase family 4 protein [Rivularia sp. (in: Bacteria)]|nr:glycosyltransferase family 4 protein [Rivularia sp. MS3]